MIVNDQIKGSTRFIKPTRENDWRIEMDHINSPKSHDRVLIVSTEETTRLLRNKLRSEGFLIFKAADNIEALRMVREEAIDIIIIDVLPFGINCFEFVKQLHQECEKPIVILSSVQNIADKVRYLELGGDDCITKPFNNEELIARIRVLLRLTKTNHPSIEPHITMGKVKIDFAAHYVKSAGHESKLSRKEYDLLHELVSNAGNVLTYSHILQDVWGVQYKTERAYVHSYIKFLRLKVEPDPHNPRFIISLPGVGYMFRNTSQ